MSKTQERRMIEVSDLFRKLVAERDRYKEALEKIAASNNFYSRFMIEDAAKALKGEE